MNLSDIAMYQIRSYIIFWDTSEYVISIII